MLLVKKHTQKNQCKYYLHITQGHIQLQLLGLTSNLKWKRGWWAFKVAWEYREMEWCASWFQMFLGLFLSTLNFSFECQVGFIWEWWHFYTWLSSSRTMMGQWAVRERVGWGREGIKEKKNWEGGRKMERGWEKEKEN